MSECKDDPWWKLRAVVAVVLVVGGFVFVVYEISSNKHREAVIRADIKERCAPVYKTLENGNVTSIYRCPDDTQYEFTERI